MSVQLIIIIIFLVIMIFVSYAFAFSNQYRLNKLIRELNKSYKTNKNFIHNSDANTNNSYEKVRNSYNKAFNRHLENIRRKKVMKYRKKPVEIEAIQWTGDNYKEICDFVGQIPPYPDSERKDVIIETLEGDMLASVNDFIIKGVQGEFYPCKPDIFEATYEKVEE